jgi:uncharacterized membrane protein YbaN (DUF454 family)
MNDVEEDGRGASSAVRNLLKRRLLVALGFVCVGIGVVGVVVPLLPTTPFLLLAAYCFLRGSPRWHAWLLGNRVFGRYISGYLTYGTVPRRAKAGAIVVLWISLGVSGVVVHIWYVAVVLAVIGVLVTIHVVRLGAAK